MKYVSHHVLYGELVKKCGRGMELLLSRMISNLGPYSDAGYEAHIKAVRDLARRNNVPVTMGPYLKRDPDFDKPKRWCYTAQAWVMDESPEQHLGMLPSAPCPSQQHTTTREKRMLLIKVMSAENRPDTDVSKGYKGFVLEGGDSFEFYRLDGAPYLKLRDPDGVESHFELSGNAYVLSASGKTIATFAHADVKSSTSAVIRDVHPGGASQPSGEFADAGKPGAIRLTVPLHVGTYDLFALVTRAGSSPLDFTESLSDVKISALIDVNTQSAVEHKIKPRLRGGKTQQVKVLKIPSLTTAGEFELTFDLQRNSLKITGPLSETHFELELLLTFENLNRRPG